MKTLQELLSITEEAKKKVDLETFTGKSIPHEAWTDGVMYKGLNVYKTIYDGGPAEKQIEEQMSNLKEEFDGTLDMQETYLGYSPSRDLFIQGYDGWATIAGDTDGDDMNDYDEDGNHEETEEDYNCSPYIIFKLSENGSIKVQDIGDDYGDEQHIWYGGSQHSKGRAGGGLKRAHKNFSDLIDIRLD